MHPMEARSPRTACRRHVGWWSRRRRCRRLYSFRAVSAQTISRRSPVDRPAGTDYNVEYCPRRYLGRNASSWRILESQGKLLGVWFTCESNGPGFLGSTAIWVAALVLIVTVTAPLEIAGPRGVAFLGAPSSFLVYDRIPLIIIKHSFTTTALIFGSTASMRAIT